MADRPAQRLDTYAAERMALSIVDPDSPYRITPKGDYKKPAFVKFDPKDDAANLDEIFWEDPYTFTPRTCRNGYIEHWGLYPHDEDMITEVPLIPIQTRKFITQFIYDDKTNLRPELQFVNVLIEKKVKELAQIDLGDLPKRDYTLYVAITYLEHPTDPTAHRYWRRICVSGGLPLGVFADKVLTPVWGWVRNLHTHTFHDLKDGAMFGPKDCNSIDIMHHLDNAGYAYIPEESYCIAHVLREVGDVMYYHYDFGDNWFVDIKVEDIAAVESSTGAVVVLAGRGGRPPDGERVGTWDWQKYLKKADAFSRENYMGKYEAVEKLFTASNYKDRDPPWNPFLYSFDLFDIEECREEVRAALDSKTSLPYAMKRFIMPFGEGSLEQLQQANQVSGRLGIKLQDLKKGNVVVHTPTGSGEQFMEEGVNVTRRDNPANTACARCGSPHGLKACGGCGQRFYCGKTCQTGHWKEKHKLDCKNLKTPRKH